MKPLYLAMKDFMNYGEAYIDFSKLSNAISIIGIEGQAIKESNAAGKTNLFNAIKYVLFNSKISNAKDKVIRHETQKCEVMFIFELANGEIYKIERCRTRSTQYVKIYIKEENDWRDISGKTTAQTEQIILNIIRITEQTFENSSYLKQNDYKRRRIDTLASATPEEKKAIILDMLQLEIWNKCEEKAKKLRDATSLELNKVKSLVEAIGDPKNIIENKKQSIIKLEANIAEYNKKIAELSIELQDKNNIKNNLKNSLSDEFPKLEKQLNQEKSFLKNILTQAESCKRQIKDLEKETIFINMSLSSLKAENAAIEAELKNNNEQETLLIPDMEALLNDISKLKNKIRENKSILSLLKKPIPDDEFCKECGTELTFEAKQDLLKNKTNKAAELDLIVIEDTERLNKLFLDKADADNAILKQSQKTEKINKLKSSLLATSKEIIDYEKLLVTKTYMINSHGLDLKSKDKYIDDATNNIENIKNKLLTINQKEIEDKISIINKEISLIEIDIKNQRTLLSNSTYELGQAKAILEIKETELVALQSYEIEKKKLEKQFLLYKAAFSCFNSSGIPAMIIYSTLTSLQNETNILLEKIKPKIQLKFIISKENDKGVKSDTLDVIYYKSGIEHDFMDLSGGEQSAVVLAIKLAMAYINRKRHSIDIALLLLDEVDAALDPQSTEKFFDIIKELSNEMTILVITHQNILKDKFNSYILIKANNGVSTIEAYNDGNFSN